MHDAHALNSIHRLRRIIAVPRSFARAEVHPMSTTARYAPRRRRMLPTAAAATFVAATFVAVPPASARPGRTTRLTADSRQQRSTPIQAQQ
jgi:hypothetical protein